MKLGSTLVACALLVFAGALTGTATAAEPAAPAPFSAAAPLTPAVAAAPCAEGASSLELSLFTPAPTPQTGGTCGSCSVVGCKGVLLGNTCRIVAGQIYRCLNVYAEVCSNEQPKCYCWTGELP